MFFILSSKTESEGQPNKVQMSFRYVDPAQPMPTPGNPTPYAPPTSHVNFNGTFDKEYADLFNVGGVYELSISEVKDAAGE